MMLVPVLLAMFLFFVLIGWASRQPLFQRGEWRIGLGFLGIGVLFTGLIFGAKQEYLPAAGMLAAAAVMIALARKRRSGPRLRPASAPVGRLSDSQARDILGVDANAGPQEIQAAYYRLIRMVHPDAGGSGGLAAQLNTARDTLLKA